ncbi:MerR family transcriptional regulator [Actinophytocola oryzae]|uniref:DNA-binding transcriptional MerR regulator n=1 Tax=Actinophytocola oryzae TaxID=502181 RepID=A0A4R7VYJ1_9PSEU|nr:MerR family transcriptional regulator [Actinophytocola oryzae]TDV55246.1 DNA-binding transcriptional MerR regulator [Actinophytocola oryzae]
MRIGELADRAGVSERSLRYYEEQGLLTPGRTPNGYRVYAESDVDVVRHVRMLLAAGLNTAFIKEVLPCMVDTGAGLAPGCPQLLPHLLGERERITAAIDGLATARALLDGVIAATPPDDTEYDEWVAQRAG